MHMFTFIPEILAVFSSLQNKQKRNQNIKNQYLNRRNELNPRIDAGLFAIDFTVTNTSVIPVTLTETISTTITDSVTDTSISTMTETNTSTESVTFFSSITETTTESVDFTTYVTFQSCTTDTVNITSTESVVVVEFVFVVEVQTQTATFTDTITDVITTTSTILTSGVYTEVESITSTFTESIATCNTVNPNLPELILNLENFQLIQSSQLLNLQNGIIFDFNLQMEANISANSNLTPLDLTLFYTGQTMQLLLFQNTQMQALINGQNQLDQLSEFNTYQNLQFGQLLNFQDNQTTDPAWNTLPLGIQTFLTGFIFPTTQNDLGLFQQIQLNEFLAFQASQAPLYT